MPKLYSVTQVLLLLRKGKQYYDGVGGVSYLLHSDFNILTTCNGTVRNGGPQMKSEIILVIMTIKYF